MRNFLPDRYGLYDKPYRISTPELGIAMVEALGKHNAVLLAGHGATAVSQEGPEDAIQRLMELEQLCKMNWLAFTAVGRDYEKYAFSDETVIEDHKPRTTSTWARGPSGIPGQDLTRDQCYYNAAMAKTYRETVEG
jgi:ribulose-5-phosphate 4-epimerase/fuculose-1-phosphate aldolase